MKEVKIAVLGAGSWGSALAILLAKKGHSVDMWSRDRQQVEDMLESRENKKYLAKIKFPENLNITNDIEEAINYKDILLLAVPTHSIRQLLEDNKHLIDEDQIIVNLAKGIENSSLMRISDIVAEILENNKYVMLSGPSHAEEVGLDIPTTVVSASTCEATAEYIQDVFMTPKFRVYTNPDVTGVELGGALKNIIALTAGISDGLGYGDNTKAALMTRGIVEIARLGVKLGAEDATFSGLAGIGDLIVTCTSMHSRNRRAGILIGEGRSVEDATKEVGMVVEGIKTTKSAYQLAKKHGVSMPITEELYKVLYEESNVRNSVDNLMGRSKKDEMRDLTFECKEV